MLSIEQIARIAHEANRFYCHSIGDFSIPAWEDADKAIQRSVINGVIFHRDNSLAMPRDSHDNWVRFKLEEGWQYGPFKNFELKTHPCLVAWDALPDYQKSKDFIFIGVVRALLKEE